MANLQISTHISKNVVSLSAGKGIAKVVQILIRKTKKDHIGDL